jgi:hypothetical protein
MPIERFRHLDDARRALWTRADDMHPAERLRRLWRFSARLATSALPRGVRRFRSIEEANADRDRHVTARVRALAAARGRGRPPE